MAEPQKELKGLYRNVKISVRALDAIIISCVLVIVFLLALEMRNPGFRVTFNSRGGTDVASQTRMFGETLEPPEEPTREGYTFTGWYRDQACDEQWILESNTVQSDMTLYAGWKLK